MCDVDLESCTVFNETVVKKAKKDHECDCCGGPIPKGSSYLKHFSVFDGSVTNEKQCDACTKMVEDFTKVHKQHTNPSYMPELLYECIASERAEGNTAMVRKWQTEINAMRVRSGRPPKWSPEEMDDGEDEEDDEDEEAGDDQDREAGRD